MLRWLKRKLIKREMLSPDKRVELMRARIYDAKECAWCKTPLSYEVPIHTTGDVYGLVSGPNPKMCISLVFIACPKCAHVSFFSSKKLKLDDPTPENGDA